MRGNRDIFSGKVYTIARLLVDKNIGLVNTDKDVVQRQYWLLSLR